jgi:hypothetical protein
MSNVPTSYEDRKVRRGKQPSFHYNMAEDLILQAQECLPGSVEEERILRYALVHAVLGSSVTSIPRTAI